MAAASWKVHGKNWRCFGQSIAFLNVDSGPGEDARELGVQRGSSASHSQYLAAQSLLPLAKNQLASQFELHVVEGAEAFVFVAFRQAHGPKEESALDAGQCLALVHYFVVDLLEQAGNRRKHLRMHLAQVVADGLHGLRKVDAHAVGHVHINTDPLIAVAEGQKTQGLACRADRQASGSRHRVGCDVAVA